MSFLLFDKIAAERGDGLLPEIRDRLMQRPTPPGVPVRFVLENMPTQSPQPGPTSPQAGSAPEEQLVTTSVE